VLFKDAYHELQKDICKDKVHAKVLTFMTQTILKRNQSAVKVFGGLPHDSKLRYGSLVKRKRGLFETRSFKIKMWLAIAAYLLIGLWISKRYLPSWKYN
jgi:hypothetical protein